MWKGVRVKQNACEQECMWKGLHEERNAGGQECMRKGMLAGRNACRGEMDARGTGVHMVLDCECIFGRTRSAYVRMGAAVVHAYGHGQWTERVSLTGIRSGTQSLLKLILRNQFISNKGHSDTDTKPRQRADRGRYSDSN